MIPDDPKLLTELDHEHLWHPFTQQEQWTDEDPLIITSASGCYLRDISGKRYIDGVSSLWTNVHGHRHPRLNQAIQTQLKKVAHSTLLGLTHPPAIKLAHRLANLAPWGLKRVFYSDNGSTAVEVALKMAFQYHQQTGAEKRTRFACLQDAYHGDTIGAVSVGGIDLFHSLYRPLLFDALTLPAPLTPDGKEEAECLEQALKLLDQEGDSITALVFEPLVQGAAGMKMHSTHYLQRLLHRARELGILLIADEVAVGMGRTGTLFAMSQVNIAPDFLCLAKGLAGGYLPLAATLTTEEVYEAFLGEATSTKQLFHGHTFTGNPLACAAALASLELFDEEGGLEGVQRSAEHLAYLLDSLISDEPQVAAIRQKGFLVGIDLRNPDGTPFDPACRMGHEVSMAARNHGAIIRPLQDTLVLNPPLSITHDELTSLVRAVQRAIRATMSD
ncbi:MAG: adenosylmethionine--8-amino-7-oxononanoate transaminase [Proteobacteria bacterium]|jgi:adenosylmethionine---8-amino-7-oxononanoate aminotransferase|nr:adenosylmethionine--8-amino-7-oxononanoate transaminase [Pseudomonadota bacterium]